MGQRDGWINPREAMNSEIERTEERRRECQRVYSRTDIVAKTREGEFFRARPAPDGLTRFEEKHGTARSSEGYRSCQSVGAGADYDRIVFLPILSLLSCHCDP